MATRHGGSSCVGPPTEHRPWPGNINQWGQRNGVEMVKRQFAASDDYDTVGILTRGKLQTQLDARLASR